MIKYPIDFASSATATGDLMSNWAIRSGQMEASCCVPVEFDGPGGGFSPEDLFAQALTNCFVATFKVYAHHSKLVFEKVEAKGRLSVDLGEQRKPVMKSFHLQVNIVGASQPDRAKMLAEKAFQSGFILNSVKTELSAEFSLS
jgi:organic hydroperoxide reductase OsmC/OhrA